MPRTLPENGRIELRLRPEDKATLTRAASIKRVDLAGDILGAALPQAEADIFDAECLKLTEPDSLRVLALLEIRRMRSTASSPLDLLRFIFLIRICIARAIDELQTPGLDCK